MLSKMHTTFRPVCACAGRSPRTLKGCCTFLSHTVRLINNKPNVSSALTNHSAVAAAARRALFQTKNMNYVFHCLFILPCDGSLRSPPRVQARGRELFTIPKESAEDKKRSRALLTIQSVGIISAALSFGTLALCKLGWPCSQCFKPVIQRWRSERNLQLCFRCVALGEEYLDVFSLDLIHAISPIWSLSLCLSRMAHV